MIRRLQLLLACLLALCSASSVAKVGDEIAVATGIGNTGPAVIVFAIAGALLLTLVFRSTASHIARTITGKLGTRRIHKILATRSKDVLDDCLFPGAYGGLTRVDHAILTSGGIICIQTKHYNGIVFGGTRTNRNGPMSTVSIAANSSIHLFRTRDERKRVAENRCRTYRSQISSSSPAT